MATFNESFGPIAGDALIRRLAKIFLSVGLRAYHQQGDEFLCKGESLEELNDKLSQARRLFRDPFELYADGRIQTIEETDFSFGIGTNPEEAKAALRNAKTAAARNDSPEWLRKILGTGGPSRGW
jgi:GGDEF domain-containing protein